MRLPVLDDAGHDGGEGNQAALGLQEDLQKDMKQVSPDPTLVCKFPHLEAESNAVEVDGPALVGEALLERVDLRSRK